MGPSWDHMFYIGLFRENMKKSFCLKPQVMETSSLGVWYVASHSKPLLSLEGRILSCIVFSASFSLLISNMTTLEKKTYLTFRPYPRGQWCVWGQNIS